LQNENENNKLQVTYTERIPVGNGCPQCNNNTELTSFPINPTNRLPLIIV